MNDVVNRRQKFLWTNPGTKIYILPKENYDSVVGLKVLGSGPEGTDLVVASPNHYISGMSKPTSSVYNFNNPHGHFFHMSREGESRSSISVMTRAIRPKKIKLVFRGSYRVFTEGRIEESQLPKLEGMLTWG